MKVLSTRVNGEVERKFLEKIELEGLDASDVLRRLVNSYVGETRDSLSSVADLAEVDGRLSKIDGRLRELGDDVDVKIEEKIAGRCQTLDDCVESLETRLNGTIVAHNDLLEGWRRTETKTKTIGGMIQEIMRILRKINDDITWTADEVAKLKTLGVEPTQEFLDGMKR
jgi:phage host-nuclease inhibitor protein Gam